jgi:hypothetical protein
MRGSWSSLLFFILIGLGIIGLIAVLWSNPIALLEKLLIGGLIVGGIFGLYKWLSKGKSPNESQAYRRAVRQSKKRKKSSSTRHVPRSTSKLTVIPTRSIKKKRPSLDRLKHKGHGHLTVIDGKKKKRKKGFL